MIRRSSTRGNIGFIKPKQINSNVLLQHGRAAATLQAPMIKNIDIVDAPIKDTSGSGIMMGNAVDQASKINFEGSGFANILGLNQYSSAKSSEIHKELPLARSDTTRGLPGDELRRKLLLKLNRVKIGGSLVIEGTSSGQSKQQDLSKPYKTKSRK